MNENMENKVNQIKDLLGKENMADNLKNIIGLFEKQRQGSKDDNHSQSNESGLSFDAETLQMFMKIKKILDNTNKKDDPREKLLTALKPYLNEKRQGSINNCLNILKITNLMDIMTKLEGSENNAKSKQQNKL